LLSDSLTVSASAKLPVTAVPVFAHVVVAFVAVVGCVVVALSEVVGLSDRELTQKPISIRKITIIDTEIHIHLLFMY